MGFADWTLSGTVTGALDTAEKYAGSSSFGTSKASAYQTAFNGYCYLSRNNFTCTQIRLILWVKTKGVCSYGSGTATNALLHNSYGSLTIQSATNTENPWEKFRVSLWYDVGSNTKFGRLEKWVTDTWVQQGSDTNFGTGAPTTNTVVLSTRHYLNPGVGTYAYSYAWWDELEVYTP